MKTTEQVNKYKWGIVDIPIIDGQPLYIYNVYRRFLHFFWIPVFSVEDSVASKCRDACRDYINKKLND